MKDWLFAQMEVHFLKSLHHFSDTLFAKTTEISQLFLGICEELLYGSNAVVDKSILCTLRDLECFDRSIFLFTFWFCMRFFYCFFFFAAAFGVKKSHILAHDTSTHTYHFLWRKGTVSCDFNIQTVEISHLADASIGYLITNF